MQCILNCQPDSAPGMAFPVVDCQREEILLATGHPCPNISITRALIPTFKGRQEGVVNVDGMLGMPRAEVLAKYLHVPRKHEQVYVHLLQQSFNLRLLHNVQHRLSWSFHPYTKLHQTSVL